MSRGDAQAVTWGPMGTLDLVAQYAVAFNGAQPYRPQCELAVGGGVAGRHARKTLVQVLGYPASIAFKSPRHALAALRAAAERCPDQEGRALLRRHGRAVAEVCELRAGR